MKKIKLFITTLLLISIMTITFGCENSSGNGNGGSTDTDTDTGLFSHTVTVENKSQQTGGFVIYQTSPDQETNPKLYSLAWMAQTMHPNQKKIFKWNDNYSFMWAETGMLKVGSNLADASAHEIKAIDPKDLTKNIVTLTKKNNLFAFKNSTTAGVKGKFTIVTDNKIPNNVASIGLAVQGKPVVAINALINTENKFTPTTTYWIIFGDFKEGEVLDLSTITKSTIEFSKPTKIIFPINVTEINITFKADNTFEITP